MAGCIPVDGVASNDDGALVGTTVPLRIPTNVDFPDPFSPTSACTSPGISDSDSSASARTGPYDLLICVTSTVALCATARAAGSALISAFSTST